MDSFVNDHFINILMLQQQPNLVAPDGLYDGLLSDDAVYIIPADDDDVLSDSLGRFEGELVQLENQQKIDEKGNDKNSRRESPPSDPEDIDKRYA